MLGTQSLVELPEVLASVAARGDQIVSIGRHPENLDVPPERIERVGGVKAYVTIMEGCDNFCTFCIVPFTRGRERCRPIPDVVREVEALARAGYLGGAAARPERQLVPKPRRLRPRLRGASRRGRRRSRDPSDPVHESAPEGLRRATHRAVSRSREALSAHALAGPVRVEPGARPHESRLHPRRLPAPGRGRASSRARPRLYDGSHRRIPGRERRGLRGHPGTPARGAVRRRCVLVQVLGAAIHPCGEVVPGRRPRGRQDRAPHGAPGSCSRRSSERRTPRSSATSSRCSSRGPSRKDPDELSGRSPHHRVVNFAGPGSIGELVSVRVTRTGPNSLYGRSDH